jgi:hypothetical protein
MPAPKHIEIDYHFVREKVLNQDVLISFISIADQVADIITKGLSTARFHFLQSKLKVIASPFTLRGDVNSSHMAAPHVMEPNADTITKPTVREIICS